MRRGDFYNSTGVELDTLQLDGDGIELSIDEEVGVDYTVEFVGTRRSTDLTPIAEREVATGDEDEPPRAVYRYSESIGEVFARTEGPDARYDVTGDELYVRARVISSRYHANPFAEGDVEMAWTQPLVVNQ